MVEGMDQSASEPTDQSLTGMSTAATSGQNIVGSNPTPIPSPFAGGFAPQQSPSQPFTQSTGFGQMAQQTQGFNPSNFSFGSVPSTTGQNPNFTGFNPGAVLGQPTPFYTHQSMPGFNPGMTMTTQFPGNPVASPWVFKPNLGTVLHARHACAQCDAYSNHIMSAMVDNDRSYSSAAAGINDDYASNGGIVPRPSQPFPGASYLPIPPAASGGLPYGNPPAATASSSALTGASGSSTTSTTSAQPEVNQDSNMEDA